MEWTSPERHKATAHPRILAAILTLQVAGSLPASGVAVTPDWQTRVAPQVLSIWKAGQQSRVVDAQQSAAPAPAPATGAAVAPAAKSGASMPAGSKPPSTVRYDAKGRLQVDIELNCGAAAPKKALMAAGMVIGTAVNAPPMCTVEGWASVAALPALASVPGVKKVDLPKYSKRHPPVSLLFKHSSTGRTVASAANGSAAIDGDGVSIMNADLYVQQTHVNGAGVTIAVISDDVASLSLIQGRGELPASVNVVEPSANSTTHSVLTDEGTMMLEEVYAVAPGADLAFCGPETYVEYVACLQGLVAAHATVISDDLLFPGYDVMSDPAENVATEAVENILVANPGVMIFSAAGNNAQNYWQGAYAPTSGGGTTKTCQGQTDSFFQDYSGSQVNNWSVGGSSGSDLLLAWSNTNGISSANYDLYVEDTFGNVVSCSAGNGGVFTTGATTYDYIDGSVLSGPNNYYIVIGTPDASSSGNFLKLIGLGDGADTWSRTAPGSTSSPQDFAAGVLSVGAVYGGDGVGSFIEPYSATGPIQFVVPSLSTLQAPAVVAPDGVFVDAIGTNFGSDVSSTGLFYGTSAASPNTAAVAVLILSAFPTLTPLQTAHAIEAGAVPLGSSMPDPAFGYGRVDAIGALAQIPAPAISPMVNVAIIGGTSSTALPFTLGGTGALAVKINSDSTTLVSSASPGIVISPSTCGASTSACTMVITPTLGQVGTAHVTVSSLDGASRSATAQFTVTVTKPKPPTVNLTAGASQSISEGATAAPLAFTVTGTQKLSVAAASSNSTLMPSSGISLSAGCGTRTQLSCTAKLAVAAGRSGSTTVTISVVDAYAQTGAATATITVNAPGGGGGSLDIMLLMALGVLSLLRSWPIKGFARTED
jgi:Subtilase family